MCDRSSSEDWPQRMRVQPRHLLVTRVNFFPLMPVTPLPREQRMLLLAASIGRKRLPRRSAVSEPVAAPFVHSFRCACVTS